MNVLVELHSDGYVQVYGPARCMVINRPHVTNPVDGAKVDYMLNLLLPQTYAQLRTADQLIGTGLVQKIRPSDLQCAVQRLSLWDIEPQRAMSMRIRG